MDKRIILFLILGLCSPLFGQQSSNTGSFIRGKFGFVGAKSIVPLYYKTMNEANPEEPPTYQPLHYSTMSLAGNNDYFGPSKFEIYWKPSPDKDYELVQSFPVKSGEQKNYLVWVTNLAEVKSGKTPNVRFHELKLSTKDFPYGSATVVNFTGLPVAGKVGDVEVRNLGEAGASIKFKGKKLPVQLFVYDQTRERIVSLYETNLGTGKNTRFLIFLFPSLRSYPFYAEVSLIADVEPPSKRDLDNYEFAPSE